MQSVCKLLRQKYIFKYKHNEFNKLNDVQSKQNKHSLMSLTDYISMHCWASLLYSRIVFFMKTIILNNNHYLTSTIYQLTLTYLKLLLYYKL